MPLRDFMTETASTLRAPAMASGKIGDPVTNLTSLLITKPNPMSATGQQEVRKSLNLDGTAVVIRECFTEAHSHVDSGTPVTAMPDILDGDRLVHGGITYTVKLAQEWGETFSFGETLHMYLVQDKRA